MSIQANESYRFEQEIVFDGHQYEFTRGGEAQIVRGSDGYFWDGSSFVIGETWNNTVVDSSNLFHYYDWAVPGAVTDGDTYILRIRIVGDPETETVGNMTVRPEATGTGGTGSGVRVFDGVDFATGFPSTVA